MDELARKMILDARSAIRAFETMAEEKFPGQMDSGIQAFQARTFALMHKLATEYEAAKNLFERRYKIQVACPLCHASPTPGTTCSLCKSEAPRIPEEPKKLGEKPKLASVPKEKVMDRAAK